MVLDQAIEKVFTMSCCKWSMTEWEQISQIGSLFGLDNVELDQIKANIGC